MENTYYIENLEQLKAVSDPIRWRMLSMLTSKSMTGAQLARVLDIPRARAHYHLKILKNAGLLVFEKEQYNRGMIEKYYRAIAKRIFTSKMVESENEPGDRFDNTDKKYDLFRNIVVGMIQQVEVDLNSIDPKMFIKDWYYSNQNRYFLTSEQRAEAVRQINEFLDNLQAINDNNLENLQEEDLKEFRYSIVQTPVLQVEKNTK